jgi:photosystem II stability/assembly factor-like uncharacterized protein
MKRTFVHSVVIAFLGAWIFSSQALAQEDVLLYSQDFDNGRPAEWDLSPGWEIATVESGNVLAGRGHVWATLNENYSSDYSLRFKIKLNGDAAVHANFRLAAGPSRYYIGLNRNALYLSKQTGPDTFIEDLARAAGLGSGWYSVEITGSGSTVTVMVNGQIVMTFNDPEPLLSGGIAFESLTEAQVWIDEVEIWGQVTTSSPTMTGGFAWVRTGGPLGGLGYDVRMHPGNPDIMFVTDSFAGVFKSTDGGQTWFPSNNGITVRSGTSFDAIPIFCLTIDPTDADVVWAGTQNLRGIFKSEDGGDSWVEKTHGIRENQGITFRGITIDPRDPEVVYAAAELSSWAWAGSEQMGREFDKTKGVVYKTTDGGENWVAVWRGDNLARYIWIDPRDSNVLYVSTGIFDREAANSDHITITPGGVGILKSTDGGQSWTQINQGLTNLYVGTLFMHPQNPDILLAGAGNNTYLEGGGVFLTTNGGAQWQRVLQDNVQAVEFAASDPQIAYAGNPGFIYRSQDGGRTWQATLGEADLGWGAPGVEAGFPIDFQVDPRDPNRIFANNYGGGNFMSLDGGVNWVDASRGYTGAQVRAIAVAPGDPAWVLAAARSGIFGSYDGGDNWEGLNYPMAAGLEWNAVAVDPANPQHVLAANNWYGGIYASQDGGRSWSEAEITRTSMQGWRVIAFASSDARTVYAGSGAFGSAGSFNNEMPASGIYRSVDGGGHWEAANNALTGEAQVTGLAVHPADARVVYAASPARGLFATRDGGTNWTRLEGLPPKAMPLSVALNPAQPEQIFVGMQFGGLYRSENGGQSWAAVAAGLPPESSVTSILFNPGTPGEQFFADAFSGVYRSTDGGATWNLTNQGLRTRAVNALALSSDGQHLYAATEGEGVYRLDLNGQAPQGVVQPQSDPAQVAGMPPAVFPDDAPRNPGPRLPCPGGAVPLALAGALCAIRRRRYSCCWFW